MDHFDDIGPSVVMASPGMMQSGLSRELFESWCTDKRNGVIIAGYCVEGTLAKVRPRQGPAGLYCLKPLVALRCVWCAAHHVRAGGDRHHVGTEAPAEDVGGLHLLLRTHRLPADQRVHQGSQASARGGNKSQQPVSSLCLNFAYEL